MLLLILCLGLVSAKTVHRKPTAESNMTAEAAANQGFLAEPSSQEEHDTIKARLAIIDGDVHTSYWLGGVDYFEEGVWQWANGDPFTFTQWHEGEPNNVDNEDCLSMSSQDSYEWQDLGCGTRDHDGS